VRADAWPVFLRALSLSSVIVVLACAENAVAAGVDTAISGNTCAAVRIAGTPDPTLDAVALGDLKAGYEVGAPTGAFAAWGVRRVMVLVHGGSWYKVGRGAVAAMRTMADGWRAAGWETVNTDYRACRRSLHDVLAAYDAVRARVAPNVPVCLAGVSAGAHLALMVAALRDDVDCVLAEAGPTDLRSIAAQAAAGATVEGLARAAFGSRGLVTRSPVTYAAQIRARLLLVATADDALVPYAQQSQLADAIHAAHATRYVDTLELPPGAVPFIHGTTSPTGLTALKRRTARLVAPFGAAPATASEPFRLRRHRHSSAGALRRDSPAVRSARTSTTAVAALSAAGLAAMPTCVAGGSRASVDGLRAQVLTHRHCG